jgi:DNA-binding transcriptional ArsR family regulator
MQKSYYAIIPANVRYDKDIPANAKLLYGEITALTNEKGYCWAGNKYFADLYGTSIRSVTRWVKLLSDKGYIETKLIYKEGTKEVGTRYISLPLDKNDYTPRQNCLPPLDKIVQDNNTLNNTINNNKNEIYEYDWLNE